MINNTDTLVLFRNNNVVIVSQYTTGSTGMPIGVQFVALPFCEEILCRIMTEFSRAINYN